MRPHLSTYPLGSYESKLAKEAPVPGYGVESRWLDLAGSRVEVATDGTSPSCSPKSDVEATLFATGERMKQQVLLKSGLTPSFDEPAEGAGERFVFIRMPLDKTHSQREGGALAAVEDEFDRELSISDL
jgi:hypothetical protein